MRGKREMIVVVLMLCAVRAHGFDGEAVQNLPCVHSQEVSSLRPADYLNASGPVGIEVCAGKKLNISLERFSGDPVCNWSRGMDPILTFNRSYSLVLPPLSEADSGEYTLSCETSNGTRSSLTVSLHVMLKRPTKPQLILIPQDGDRSPLFKCVSEGWPAPTMKWFNNLHRSGNGEEATATTNNQRAESTLESFEYMNTPIVCCATNAKGEECSQLYDYDIDTALMKKDEASEVLLSPDQSLLLRCRTKTYTASKPEWERDGKIMDASPANCPMTEEICITKDRYGDDLVNYLFIESVNVKHSGIYTCTRHKNNKNVYIRVLAEGFLIVQLDETKTISAQTASSFTLQAYVSSHPVLQHCTWEDPDKNKIACRMPIHLSNNRTVALQGPWKSGEYKLHLEAGGQRKTETVSLCVAEEPTFSCYQDYSGQGITCETTSPGPANIIWKSCPQSNDSRDLCSDVPGTSQEYSDWFCYKKLSSFLSTHLRDGNYFEFCLNNSLGFWCKSQMYYQFTSQPSIGGVPDTDNGSSMVLKVGSLFLLLALTVVIVVLIYIAKKKKPQYQSQLQMIQMVGPSDNDYIYINFKDFQYDQKWEFPRENLVLGKGLGSGAFGMVVQATAFGINKPGVSQQVAVKMLKEKHQAVEKEALMSELKMLTHIGQHANIVNLLGACTGSGPTYLIFQYCCYGDLLNYLKNNSERYHKSLTDAFNKDRFSNLYHNLQAKRSSSEFEKPAETYVPMHPSTTRGQENLALLSLNSSPMDSVEDPGMYEESEEQPEEEQTLTYNDLLSFAYQVAQGMEFLSSMNCIHRDLAARNMLVTKGRLVKIGDFGLARDIDNDSNYVVRGNVRLPVKWMAPESIFQGMYTMKSDVWAYGILLWEIFSLGITPYPGVKVDNNFYSMIERGFKMECPYYASESVYGMMCKCWALEPSNRPPFSKLVTFMDDQLTDMEEKLYHNVPDQNSSDYQNAPAILDISALTKEKENQTQSYNQYCQTHATEEITTTTSGSDTIAADDKYMKPAGTGSE